MSTLRAELHCHTYWSKDCLMRPERMVETCLARGIGVLAVTDHNEFGASLELAAIAPFTVIPGEEVKSADGEIIGYFLSEHIPRGLSAEETAIAILEQGGVVNIPHPFDSLRGGRIMPEALDRLASRGLVDMLEVFNARMTRPEDNLRAYQYAEYYGLPMVAGSDAHTYAELGTAWTELRPFNGPRDFVRAVREGRLCGGLAPWPVHFASTWAKLAKRIGVGR